jgi:hypothetical protein
MRPHQSQQRTEIMDQEGIETEYIMMKWVRKEMPKKQQQAGADGL